jgi:hypothetical protein
MNAASVCPVSVTILLWSFPPVRNRSRELGGEDAKTQVDRKLTGIRPSQRTICTIHRECEGSGVNGVLIHFIQPNGNPPLQHNPIFSHVPLCCWRWTLWLSTLCPKSTEESWTTVPGSSLYHQSHSPRQLPHLWWYLLCDHGPWILSGYLQHSSCMLNLQVLLGLDGKLSCISSAPVLPNFWLLLTVFSPPSCSFTSSFSLASFATLLCNSLANYIISLNMNQNLDSQYRTPQHTPLQYSLLLLSMQTGFDIRGQTRYLRLKMNWKSWNIPNN